jgi:hypothetical protein
MHPTGGSTTTTSLEAPRQVNSNRGSSASEAEALTVHVLYLQSLTAPGACRKLPTSYQADIESVRLDTGRLPVREGAQKCAGRRSLPVQRTAIVTTERHGRPDVSDPGPNPWRLSNACREIRLIPRHIIVFYAAARVPMVANVFGKDRHRLPRRYQQPQWPSLQLTPTSAASSTSSHVRLQRQQLECQHLAGSAAAISPSRTTVLGSYYWSSASGVPWRTRSTGSGGLKGTTRRRRSYSIPWPRATGSVRSVGRWVSRTPRPWGGAWGGIGARRCRSGGDEIRSWGRAWS